MIPTLVMYLLRGHEHEDKFKVENNIFAPLKRLQIGFERRFELMRDGYHRVLTGAMEHRRIFITCFLGFCFLSLGLVFFLGEDFFPDVEAGTLRGHACGRRTHRLRGRSARPDKTRVPEPTSTSGGRTECNSGGAAWPRTALDVIHS